MSSALAAGPALRHPATALRLTTFRLDPAIAVVEATGELDAANARELVDHVVALRDHTALVLNLSDLAFFGTEGLWALNRVNGACAKRRAIAAIVAGRQVHRLLRICDPHGGLRVHASMEQAVAVARRRPHHLTAPPL